MTARKQTDEPEVPRGPDRVLLYADDLAAEAAADEEEREQQLESWISCRLGEERFCLPVGSVREVLRVSGLTRVPHAPYPVRGVTNMRGHVLPVVDLRLRLGLPPQEPGPRHRIVVVITRGRLVGLLVDAVDQVTQIDRLQVEQPPEDVMTERSYYIEGVVQREDGLLILLDPDRVVQVREVDDVALAAEADEGGAGEKPAKRRRKVRETKVRETKVREKGRDE